MLVRILIYDSQYTNVYRKSCNFAKALDGILTDLLPVLQAGVKGQGGWYACRPLRRMNTQGRISVSKGSPLMLTLVDLR
jgi:hypothetical protein